MPVQPWTADEDALIRAAYEDDALPQPFVAACARLPHRTPSAISFRASTKGWAAARRARLGLPPAVGYPGPRHRKAGPAADAQPQISPPSLTPADEWREAAIVAERERDELRRQIVLMRLRAENAEATVTTLRAQNADLAENVRAARAQVEALRCRVDTPPPAPSEPPPSGAPVTRLGPCDRGEREIIRRRLVTSTIPALAREVGRAPSAVAEAVVAIVADRFRSQTFATSPDPFAAPTSSPKVGKRP